MPKKKPESTPAEATLDTAPQAASPVKTADAIRAALRNRSNGAGTRSGKNPYGADQKPPTPPYGTRRSMGKR